MRTAVALAVGGALGAFATSSEAQSEDPAERARSELEQIIVSATRGIESDKAIANKVTRIELEEIEIQQALATSPTDMLSNLLPSYSPTRQKLTGLGESFRGRRPLYLIDGVPQSNPLRDGSRDGFTTDMGVIEKVEVIHGANAIQGLGATGGIVNFITVSPPRSGELEQRAEIGLTTDDGFHGDGFGWRTHYLAGQRFGRFDATGSVTFEKRGLGYDGDGNPVGIDETQGDIADSGTWNFFGKLGFEPTDNQRIQLMVNKFNLQMDNDFVSVPGNRAAGIPVTSVPGQTPGEPAENDVLTMTLNYAHLDLWGGRFTSQAFLQDFSSNFGGGDFAIFQDPAIAPVGTLFDQSENNSTKFGIRLTQSWKGVFGSPFDAIVGLDYLRDKTFQSLIFTGRNWVPVTRYNNYAPFIQLDVDAGDWLHLTGGGRWEIAELDVPSYTTLAGNRPDFMVLVVDGGKPDFSEGLFNFGAVVDATEAFTVYGTYSQGFTMPDVGRVLRGVTQPGTDVDDFLDLEPVVTDNFEIGAELDAQWGSLQLAWFESSTDLGVRLVPNADGIFEVSREKTEITGWEIRATAQPTEWLGVSLAYANLDGEFDTDGDGSVDADLGAVDIGPDRLNLVFDVRPGGRWSGRLQAFTYRDRTFRNAAGATTAEFDGYTLVDALLVADLDTWRLTFGVSNLLDEQYITYFGQAGTDRDDRYFPGRGRTFTARVNFEF